MSDIEERNEKLCLTKELEIATLTIGTNTDTSTVSVGRVCEKVACLLFLESHFSTRKKWQV